MPSPVKVLIFGKHGQVGSQLVTQLKTPSYHVDPGDFSVTATDIEDVDLTDSKATRALVMEEKPDWVINTSAHTAVDKAESEYDLAYQLNAEAPRVIAEACRDVGAAMVHYSTDYVFDGNAKTPYLESDSPNPQSVYGKTKLAGEQNVAQLLPQHFIFRTAWVYSKNGKNFVNTMLELAKDRDALSVVGDQYGSPTLADDLAAATIQVMRKMITAPDVSLYGIYHATGSGITNWSDFCREIMQLSNNHHVSVSTISTDEYPTPAPRPHYSVLNNAKLKADFNIELDSWKSALARCLQRQS